MKSPVATATPKQADILDYVRQCIEANGYAPTYDEIGEYLGITKVTVFEHIEALVRKGLLTRDKGFSRSLKLPTHCPTCGQKRKVRK